MRVSKQLSSMNTLCKYFLFFLMVGSLSGCGLADSFMNVFNDDDIKHNAVFSGEMIDYNNQSLDLIPFLEKYIFVEDRIVTDNLNLVESIEQRQYFYYLSDINRDIINVNNRHFYNGQIYQEEANGYSYEHEYSAVSIINDNDQFFNVFSSEQPNHRSSFFFNSVRPSSEITCGTFSQKKYVYCTHDGLSLGGFSDRSEIIPKTDNRFNIKFPVRPTVSNSPTSLDGYSVIGLARNGVPLVQYDLDLNQPYQDLKFGLDEYYARPANEGYQYFAEPTFFTGYFDLGYFSDYVYEDHFYPNANRWSLIGIARDGFPIYGPHEFQTARLPFDLDTCGGHVGETGDHFSNYYHYHVKPIENIAYGDVNLFIECFSGVLFN